MDIVVRPWGNSWRRKKADAIWRQTGFIFIDFIIRRKDKNKIKKNLNCDVDTKKSDNAHTGKASDPRGGSTGTPTLVDKVPHSMTIVDLASSGSKNRGSASLVQTSSDDSRSSFHRLFTLSAGQESLYGV